MKILVIGGGGREHALVWKLAQSSRVNQMWCAPGNAGTTGEHLASNGMAVENVALAAADLPGLLKFALEKKPDLTVVGPDDPLAAGIVDLFQKNQLRIWGPNQRAAQFESSKIFSQLFMERHGIPAPRAASFSRVAEAVAFAESLQGRCAVKADGLALGKGVVICHNMEEARAAIAEMLVAQKFGLAGQQIIIQELLEGIEVSLHALCDGRTTQIFPVAQDHKRVGEGDTGLNTGGMGAYCPAPFLTGAALAGLEQTLFTPWRTGCRAENIHFCGMLYPGIMLTEDGPKVLEFNARFGDPETQSFMMRLETDLAELLDASVDGRLHEVPLRWCEETSVCVVMAAAGYPGPTVKGTVIRGLNDVAAMPGVKVFHAGTALLGGNVVVNGGRVLGVTALGRNLDQARDLAYAAVAKIQFDGAHFRRDIASRALAWATRENAANPQF